MNNFTLAAIIFIMIGVTGWVVKWTFWTPKYVAMCMSFSGQPMINPNITRHVTTKGGTIQLYTADFFGPTMTIDANRCVVTRRETN